MDDPLRRVRRSAPGWVRRLNDRDLHGLTGKLSRLMMEPETETSDRQMWLFDACVQELEWRAWNDSRHGIRECVCQWCCQPDPFPDGVEDPR